MIQSTVEQVKRGPLTLSCSESIMMDWLIPRLARFQEAHPEVELRNNMSHGTVDSTRDTIGVAIRLSTIDPPPEVIRSDGITEWIGPVCSAEYLRTLPLTSTCAPSLTCFSC